MQPGSRYAISSSELITAINDGAIERIVLRAGIYEFADSMCSDTNVGDSALCINRTVTIEAEVAGSVVLDAKGTKRVITVLSGAVAKLVGLNITGGAVVGRVRPLYTLRLGPPQPLLRLYTSSAHHSPPSPNITGGPKSVRKERKERDCTPSLGYSLRPQLAGWRDPGRTGWYGGP